MKRTILAGILAALAVLTVVTVSGASQAPAGHAVPQSGDHPIVI
ncbi:hypothetical protein [Streptacidiphilus sp. PB12-B1b]|nr:hypothetical protein [Streptacidiphilus sp. PB12-B1b]